MVINAYRALTKDEKIVICNATSMENALKLLSVDYNEPKSIILDKENVLTESVEYSTVDISTMCVDNDGEILTETKVYPTSLENVTRGNTIYFSNVAQEGYEFDKWILPNGDEVTDEVLMIKVTNDESITSLEYKCVFKSV